MLSELENEPLVSVVIPVYNREKSLKPAVQSVLAQTYRNVEVIIVDDGSTDKSAFVATDLANVDERIRVVTQENAGACNARNRGIDLASGNFIAFQDSDDFWLPNKLESQMKAMKEKNADVVVCKLVLHVNGNPAYLLPKRVGEGFISLRDDLFGIGTQTIVARKTTFEKEKFDPNMPRLQELEWFLRVAREFRTYCVGEGLVEYSIYPDSITSNPEKLYKALEMILNKHPQTPHESPLTAMHAVKDLMENMNGISETGVSKSKVLNLASKWYPGALKFLYSKAIGVRSAKRSPKSF